jgi:FkbM family methyltransferase
VGQTFEEALPNRPSYMNSLRLLELRGFAPRTVIDVGAAEGAFFLRRRRNALFPGAQHFFIDAMVENEAIYRRLTVKFGGGFEIAALSCLDGQADLRIDPDFYNTHIDGVQDATPYPGTRRVTVSTLDGVARRHALAGPYLLKLDVQGSELDVLRGSLAILEEAIIVVSEISIFSSRDSLVELLGFMQGQGWSLFDLTDMAYHRTDFSLYQCYAVFIPKSIDFRRRSDWCGPEELDRMLDGLRARRAGFMEEIEALLR